MASRRIATPQRQHQHHRHRHHAHQQQQERQHRLGTLEHQNISLLFAAATPHEGVEVAEPLGRLPPRFVRRRAAEHPFFRQQVEVQPQFLGDLVVDLGGGSVVAGEQPVGEARHGGWTGRREMRGCGGIRGWVSGGAKSRRLASKPLWETRQTADLPVRQEESNVAGTIPLISNHPPHLPSEGLPHERLRRGVALPASITLPIAAAIARQLATSVFSRVRPERVSR